MSNAALIILTVTSFVANPSPTPTAPFCHIAAPTFQSGPGNSGQMDANGQVEIVEDSTIVVTRRNPANAPIKLVFSVGEDSGISPIDIIFVQARGSDDVNGTTNFRNKAHSGNEISVDDFWVSRGNRHHASGVNQAPHWKYYIRVTNGNETGWIDPGIENGVDN